MHVFKCLCFLEEINNLFTDLVVCIACFEYWFLTVA